MKILTMYRAGVSGQPMPIQADRLDGRAIAITSAIAGTTAIVGFGLGRIVYKAKPDKPEPDKPEKK